MKDHNANLLKIQGPFTNYADRGNTRIVSMIMRMVMIMMLCNRFDTSY